MVDYDAVISEAIELRNQGSIDEGIAVLEAALAQDISAGELLPTLATMLAESGRDDQAERMFARAIENNPEQPMLWFNYGSFLANSGQVETAATAFGLEAARALTALTSASDVDEVASAITQLAQADCAIARCAMDRGEIQIALALLERWLSQAAGAPFTTELLRDYAEATDQNWLALCEDYHLRRRASAEMIDDLIEAFPQQAADLYKQASQYLPHLPLPF